MTCTRYESATAVKNGHAHTGKQRYLCRACGYPFTLRPQNHRVSPQEALVDQLLSERLPHRGIYRVAGVSRSWFRLHLQYLVHTAPQRLEPPEADAKKG